MRTRSHLSADEREARSRLLHLVDRSPLLHGSLVTMSRTCGKENCKCQTGEKHVSLYVSAIVGKKRKMVYIPPALEAEVREWVRDCRDAYECMEMISEECAKRLRKAKEKHRAGRTRRS